MYLKQIKSIFVISMFLTMTIWISNPVENTKADEIDLNENFIDDVLYDLTSIASETYWMGREHASPGEILARTRLMNRWNNYIAIEDSINNSDDEEIDKEIDKDGIDDKLVIKSSSDYSLEIDGTLIDDQSCYPVPTMFFGRCNLVNEEYKAIMTPPGWYTEEGYNLQTHSELNEELREKQILYDVEYVLINDAGGVYGNLVYIEDYDSASINETNNTVHLIELDQNSNDDIYNITAQKVFNSGGSSFIAIVTNPSFINQTWTKVPGIAISRHDGEILKQKVKNNDIVIVDIEDYSYSKEGVLQTYSIKDDYNELGTKYIYIIDAGLCKYDGVTPRDIRIVTRVFWHSLLTPDKPIACAFLMYDLNDDTHLMVPHTRLRGNPKYVRSTLRGVTPIPGFFINKTTGSAIENDDIVKITLKAEVIEDVDSFNVIGQIDPSSGPSSDVVIVCGHFDSYWGQCAIDNAVGPASVWGVAKYFSDNYNILKDDLKYTIKFVAFSFEEYGLRGSKFYVWNNIIKGDENVIAVINLDTACQDTTQINPENPPISFGPWVYPSRSKRPIQYLRILKTMRLGEYTKKTGYKADKPHDYDRDVICSFTDTKSFKRFEHKIFEKLNLSNLFPYADNIIALERWGYKEDGKTDDYELLKFWDHRSGEDFTTGDILSKVDYNDLYATTQIMVNLAKLFALNCCVNFNTDCTFTQQDLDSDGNYDSVKIGYEVTTSNLSSLGNVEAVIYQSGQPKSSTFATNLFNITHNKTVYGNITVTLPPNVTAGNYNIKVFLNDINGSQDDTDNSTIYLYPYNHSIANFTWELNDNNLKMVNFTDMSMPSPNAVLSSWNWSFGDGNYSNLQNSSHNYSEVGVFNVTLTVTDNVNKIANITKQVETFNSEPVASFSSNTTLVMVNNPVTFNSTSFDVDGSIVNTTWYFGDNTTNYGSDITHSFSESGFFNIGVVVKDNDNVTQSKWKNDHILVVNTMVDDGYTDNPNKHKWDSIQEGINDVNDNDTIYVYNGSYNPYLVNKSINIYGENKNGVSISTTGIGIDIQSHDIHIKNFTVNGGTTGVKITSTINGTGNTIIENGIIPGPLTYGVYIDNSTNNTIKNCEIEKADAGVKICNGAMYNVIDDCEFEGCYNGVGIYSSSYNWVGNPSIYDWYPNDCTFKLNTNAVYIDESDHNFILGCDIDADSPLPFGTYRGIYLDEASNTTISTCDIYEGTQGIYIKDSMDSKVEFCRIKENQMGIEFYGLDAKDNLIVQNNITGNTQFGIFIPAEPSNNSIYYNDFIDNVNPGIVNQSHDDRGSGLMNIWEKSGNRTLTKTGNGEGNYWDDYTGRDLGSDGIGDTPYELDTISARVIKDDDYPVMTAYNWCTGTGWS